MTLLDVQRRYTSLGEIRLGEKVFKNGREYPSKLTTFRLTSPSRDALAAVAARYGGEVEGWENGEYQVTTKSDRLEVMLPPFGNAQSYRLAYELWSAGGLQRRCDGESAMVAKGETLAESGCLCDPDARECKPTLRVNFFLPDIPGFGTWLLSSRGYNAAAELPGMLDLLASVVAAGKPVKAILRLEQRVSKRGGQTRKFAVPVIELPYSLAQLTAEALPGPSNGETPALAMSSSREAHIGAEPEVPVNEQSGAGSAQPAQAGSGQEVTPPPTDVADLDEPLTGEQLTRWLAGTHAAMRQRIPAAADEHVALRSLAIAVVGMDVGASLNDLTVRQWGQLAHTISAIPIQQPERTEDEASGGDSPGGAAPVSQPGPEAAGAPAVGNPPDPAPAPADGASPPGPASPATPPAAPRRRAARAESTKRAPSAPAPAPRPRALTLDEATLQVSEIGERHGLPDWTAVDPIALAAMGKNPNELSAAEWVAFGERLEAGEFDPAVVTP